MSADVIRLPTRSRPRPLDSEGALQDFIFGDVTPQGDNNPIEPRAHFGLRVPGLSTLAVREAFSLAAESEARGHARVRAAAQKARAVGVDPSLLLALAAQVHQASEMLSRCAEMARSYRLMASCANLVELASLAETEAALIEAPAHLGDAQ